MSNSVFYNTEIEKDLISCLLKDKKAALKAITELKPDDFYDTTNKCVFMAVSEVFKRNNPIETALISAELETMGIVDGRKYIAALQYNFTAATAAKGLIQKIKEMSHRRTIFKYVQEVKASCETAVNFDEVLTVLRTPPVIENESAKIYTTKELVSDANKRLIERRTSGNDIHGITTGFKDIDVLTGGLAPKEMTILGAETVNR